MSWATSRHRGSTREWRRIRQHILALAPTCYLQYDCCTTVATEVDHVVPLAQGGADTATNAAGACAACHKRKTQREAATARHTTSRHRPAEPHPGLTNPQ